MATVTAIYRYPVKGLSAEKMNRVALIPGECLPHDRRFAIALGSTHFDPQCPEWLSKTNFIMLMPLASEISERLHRELPADGLRFHNKGAQTVGRGVRPPCLMGFPSSLGRSSR